MLIQRGTREDAIHSLMNIWLKMPDRWCLNCNQPFDEVSRRFGCCDQPYMTTNALVFKHFLADMAQTRELQKNDFASTGDTNTKMRHLLRFPPTLLQFLDAAMMRLYEERLFTKEYDQIWFAKKFGKYFCVANKI